VAALIGPRRPFQWSETGQTVSSKFKPDSNNVSVFRLKLNTYLRIAFKNDIQKSYND
jgi:hypothetical protein